LNISPTTTHDLKIRARSQVAAGEGITRVAEGLDHPGPQAAVKASVDQS
jgi:hypothetical protein